MSLSEIFSNAIRYPFGDIRNFLFVGVLSLLASLSSVTASFKIDSNLVSILAGILSFIFVLILMGYAVSVIKKGIAESDEIPKIDLATNLSDGIKALIIGIIYYIIPIIIVIILAIVTGAIGSSIDNLIASFGIFAVIAIIIFLLFAILDMVALARFANSGSLGDALSIGEVFADVKRIGIGNIILFLIISVIILIAISLISTIINLIPLVGGIISSFVVGAYIVLFYYKALGLLYASD